MLPNFARLSLKPTGLFYELKQHEADALNANDGRDPITLDKYRPFQQRDSDEATFNVRVALPNNKSTDKTYIAEGLWNWVKRPGSNTHPPVATLPETRQPIWREDWWALSDRFAPGVVYPRWVRNLPLSDPSVPDTKTYAAAVLAGSNSDAEAYEMDTLVEDVNELLTRAGTWQAGQNTIMHTNILRGAIEHLLWGVVNFAYDEQLGQPGNQALAIALGAKLLMILTSPPADNPVRLLAEAQLKGYALTLLDKLAHVLVIKTLLRAEPNLLAHLNTYRDTVLNNEDFNWGVERNGFGWEQFETRITTFRVSLRQVVHAYHWDSQIGQLLLVPPPGEEALRAINRPLNDAERRAINDLATTQEGVESAVNALKEYGARQFFATNGGEACGQLLVNFTDALDETEAFPNNIAMRDLALKQFVIVIDAYTALKLDESWREDYAMFARALMSTFNSSLEQAAIAGRIARTLHPTTDDIGTWIEEFFWRVVAPRYVEVSDSASELLAVERVFYSLVLLPNWPQRPPIVGEEEEEEEEWGGEVVPDDDSIADYLQDEADEENEAGPRPGTPMPSSPLAPRYNLRRRASRSGETPSARRQRR